MAIEDENGYSKAAQSVSSLRSLWSLLIKWEPHLLADKENPNHFVLKTLQGMSKSGSIHAPFHFLDYQ